MTDNTKPIEAEATTDDQETQEVLDQKEPEADVETQEVEEVVEPEEQSSSGESNEKALEASQKETSDESEDSDDDEEALVPLHKLKKVRNEAKNLRDRLKVAEAKVAELESVNGDEELNKAVTSLTNELRQERLQSALGAKDVGAIEPSAVVKLIDLDSIKWEGNKPQNLDEVVEKTKESFPRLFSATKGSGNVGARSSTRTNMNGKSSNELLTNAYQDD